ncbi:hypothetical protein [Streptomyces wuyuanensis]|uniref:Uncharacterized protein n=1 Tax=Streptomyces wuyuanensis TaxID=1196353 RepID=A0A1G9W133_9ACTN|nr:hypothetical protein [Streptomyces wuyuanensis]SDM77775.1 hypothetical protein SAMN05444921_11368 [Streptomyces wuyuanensis]
MRTFEITYRILPAGVGPDDYEPADLEQRTGRFEFPDAVPGEEGYGPSHPEMEAAIIRQAELPEGAEPVVGAVRLV